MKITAFLGTRDEIDILPKGIEHLRAIGVDEIVVSDMGSTDGTLEYLARAEHAGDIWLRRPAIEGPRGKGRKTLLELVRSRESDWCIFLDSAQGRVRQEYARQQTTSSNLARLQASRRAQPWVSAAGVACQDAGVDPGGRLEYDATLPAPSVVVPNDPDHIVRLYGAYAGQHQSRIGQPLYDIGPVWLRVLRGDIRAMPSLLETAQWPGYRRPGFNRRALAWTLLHPGTPEVDWPEARHVATLEGLGQRSFGMYETTGSAT